MKTNRNKGKREGSETSIMANKLPSELVESSLYEGDLSEPYHFLAFSHSMPPPQSSLPIALCIDCPALLLPYPYSIPLPDVGTCHVCM